jgi:hypothetical protein
VFPDLAFEAAFLRAALLLGVVHERDVAAWAESLLLLHEDPRGVLSDIAMTRVELTAMRDALWPLAEGADADTVCAALLTFLAEDPASRALGMDDAVRVLSLMRTEFRIPPEGRWSAKALEDRHMLAAGGSTRFVAPARDELDAWLASVRHAAFYRVAFTSTDEATAFLAALARLVERARRFAHEDPVAASRAWVLPHDVASPLTVALNDAAWRVVSEVFAPLPIASRIPYAALPDDAVLALDGQRHEAVVTNEISASLRL